MKTTAPSIGVILCCWLIFCPVLGLTQPPEVPKAPSAIQAKPEPAAITPAPTPPPTAVGTPKPTPPTPGGTPQPTPATPLAPTKALNVTELAEGLDWNLIMVLLLTVITGGVGGIVYELLILQGNIELPHKPDPDEITDKFPYAVPKFVYDLGICARIIIGAAAALAALLVLTPATTTTLLATSLVAGSAGTSVFRSIQDRLLAALAQKDAAEKGAQLQKKTVIINQALEKLSNLPPPHGAAKAISGPISVEPSALGEIANLLSEAKGIGA